jgi:hypothetical protein
MAFSTAPPPETAIRHDVVELHRRKLNAEHSPGMRKQISAGPQVFTGLGEDRTDSIIRRVNGRPVTPPR